jgi:alpha-L-rhamnosidase
MAVFTEWLRDFADEQQANGGLPGIIPTGGWGYERWGGPAWCSACILIPWYMYQYRGDARILAEHYETMRRYVDYLTASAPGGINDQGMGDWFPSKTETPVDLTSTSYYYTDALLLSQIAEILGRHEDAAGYARLAADVRKAFNDRFLDRATGQYGGGAQTANSCALYQGLVEPADVAAVVGNLAESIVKNGNHLDCGILGAKYIPHALADHGHVELAYQLAAGTTWPSWGDMVRQGATTLWEGWNADIGTHNHVMLGDISAWFFKTLAGINCDPDGPGFRKIIINPRLAGDLTWVKAHHDSLHGRIVSNWQRDGDRLVMEVTIPINTTATVHVPARHADGVSESGKPAAESAGVKFLRMENGAAVYEVGSGCYQFRSMRP